MDTKRPIPRIFNADGTLSIKDWLNDMTTYVKSLDAHYKDNMELTKVASLYLQGEAYLWFKQWYNTPHLCTSYVWFELSISLKYDNAWWNQMQSLEQDKQEARQILEKYNRKVEQGILPTPQSQEQKKDDKGEKEQQGNTVETVCHSTPPVIVKDKEDHHSSKAGAHTKVGPYRHPHYQETQHRRTYYTKPSQTKYRKHINHSSLRFQGYRDTGHIKIYLGWIDPYSMRRFSDNLQWTYRLDTNSRRWSHASMYQDASRAKHLRGEGMW